MQDLYRIEEKLINSIEKYVFVLKSKEFNEDAEYWKSRIDIIYGRRIIRQEKAGKE